MKNKLEEVTISAQLASASLLPLGLLAQPTGGVTGVVFSRADRAPIPGASAVLYRGDEVLGGGIIESAE